jgi:hypothetical protein
MKNQPLECPVLNAPAAATINAASQSLTDYSGPAATSPTVSDPAPVAGSRRDETMSLGDQTAVAQTGKTPTSSRVYIGIDNGFTGAVVRLNEPNEILCRPVPVTDLGQYRILDVAGVEALMHEMITKAGAPLNNMIVVFEQSPITPLFGARNNFVNGQNNEFWRVLLTLKKIPFTWTNPKMWQEHIFAGIRGNDTKAKAAIVCQQRFPHFQTIGYSRDEIKGIYDALCIALWARETNK